MMAVVRAREHHGLVLSAITAAVLAVVAILPATRRHGLASWLALGALALLHPGVWLGARGDCAALLDLVGLPYTIGAVVLASVIYWRAIAANRRAADPTAI